MGSGGVVWFVQREGVCGVCVGWCVQDAVVVFLWCISVLLIVHSRGSLVVHSWCML